MALLDDPRLPVRLKRLALVARRLHGGLLASPPVRLPAGGTEVTGLRDYTAGDDVRRVDWNVCARHDELVVRQYHGEGDRHVYLLLDASASMGLGGPAKFEAAKLTAAALSYVALTELDRLQVAVFAEGLVAELGPLRGEGQCVKALRFLQEQSVRPAQTGLRRTAEQFGRRGGRHGPVVVVSDLYDPHGFRAGLDVLRGRGYSPRVVEVHDPAELEPDLLGDVELADVESGTIRPVTVTDRQLARYRTLVAEHHDAVRRYSAAYRVPHVRIACGSDPEDVLLAAIGARRDVQPGEAQRSREAVAT